MVTRKLAWTAVLLGSLALAPGASHAIPELQLYLEGATYDSATETWMVENYDPANGALRLWAIGNVAGPGNKGEITDVKLAVAYSSTENLTITLTPSTVVGSGIYTKWTDLYAPEGPTLNQTVSDGSVPKLSDGQDLPSHGVYGVGTDWQEFLLGNFTFTDSPIADFITAFPESPVKKDAAQINVYDVSLSGTAFPDWLHFDLYNSVAASNKGAVFAPFSHDAGVGEGGGGSGGGVIPEPGTLLLLGTGLLGLAGAARRRTAGTGGETAS